MLKIICQSGVVKGRSTLAALVVKALREVAIPVTLLDFPREAGDAEHLLADKERYDRNVLSIGGRETAVRQSVLVTTELVTREPNANIRGDHGKYLHRTIEAIREGDPRATLERMTATFGAYASDVRDVVDAAIGMGAVTPIERVALTCAYEAVRRSLPQPELYAQLG